jgi:hypothetical protein
MRRALKVLGVAADGLAIDRWHFIEILILFATWAELLRRK